MTLRAYPIIGIARRTRVTHRSSPWRASVSVKRDGHEDNFYTFDPPYQRVVTGRFGLTPPISRRYRGVT